MSLFELPQGARLGVSQPCRLKRHRPRWLQGEELVTYFESSPGVHRGFCRVCGSPLISRHDGNPSAFGLALGVLDDDPGVKPRVNIFVAEKAPWFDITDALPQFPGFPK